MSVMNNNGYGSKLKSPYKHSIDSRFIDSGSSKLFMNILQYLIYDRQGNLNFTNSHNSNFF